ncbi:hypothetical protein FOXYSP1_13080 [Fusarium oxysporum f. sp. phaseoli]
MVMGCLLVYIVNSRYLLANDLMVNLLPKEVDVTKDVLNGKNPPVHIGWRTDELKQTIGEESAQLTAFKFPVYVDLCRPN